MKSSLYNIIKMDILMFAKEARTKWAQGYALVFLFGFYY